jgi:hypothetical protein
MMETHSQTHAFWHVELASKPDFDQAMQRIDAWYHQAIIDRPPVRFSRHNAEYEVLDDMSRWPDQQARWFDEEHQIERFLTSIEGKTFLGETFPIFWPNLGPNFFAGLYGCQLEFGEVTSWAEPILASLAQPVVLDWQSIYLAKLDSLTRRALALCAGRFMVGYTDLHPGIDWLAALRGSEQLCLDLFDDPDGVQTLLAQSTPDFLAVYDHFDAQLKAAGQPSVSWMGIPAFGRMHIPSCDFATMISTRQFREFVLPVLWSEAEAMTHNVFHMDGKGVARHLDAILELPNVQAIQWVQGVGNDQPILQWAPLIQRIQAAGKSVVVDLSLAELEPFMDAVRPEGILLCLPSEGENQERAILDRVMRW